MIGEAASRAWRRHLGRAADPASVLDALSGQGSLAAAFHETATRVGSGPALQIDGETASHGGLDRSAATVAARLREQGVSNGDRVIISGRSSIGLVECFLGVLRIGATAVFVDPDATELELRRIEETAAPRLTVADDTAGQPFRERASRRPADGHPATAMADLVRAAGEAEAGDAPSPEPDPGPALLAFTSGSTGRPKAVPLSHRNLFASVTAAMLAWRWRPDDVLTHALPLTHQHGLSGVVMTLLSGSRAVIDSRFDAEALLARIRDDTTTVLFAVPTIYARLDELVRERPGPQGSLRLATSGSAPLPEGIADRVAGWLGQVPLERYGSTEAGLVLSNPYDGPRLPGFVGTPLPGAETKIVSTETGDPVADGDDGELMVRGPQVFGGYLEDSGGPDADGWFATGDLARVDPGRGAYAITGRIKELIITGGLNVAPAEVEEVLESHPRVIEAGVFGIDSERWGETVCAAVVADPGLDEDELIEHGRDRLSSYKCPKRIVLVEELPRTPLGKLRRSALKGLL